MAQELIDLSDISNHETFFVSGSIKLQQALRATMLEEQRLVKEAITLLRTAADMYASEGGKVYGKAYMHLGDCYCKLGICLLNVLAQSAADGEFEKAEECFEKALQDMRPDGLIGTVC